MEEKNLLLHTEEVWCAVPLITGTINDHNVESSGKTKVILKHYTSAKSAPVHNISKFSRSNTNEIPVRFCLPARVSNDAVEYLNIKCRWVYGDLARGLSRVGPNTLLIMSTLAKCPQHSHKCSDMCLTSV